MILAHEFLIFGFEKTSRFKKSPAGLSQTLFARNYNLEVSSKTFKNGNKNIGGTAIIVSQTVKWNRLEFTIKCASEPGVKAK